MGVRGNISMTASQVRDHAIKNKLPIPVGLVGGQEAPKNPATVNVGTARGLPKPVRMTVPEREYGAMLEAQKRAGEIVDYRFQGISLAWGADPETGILMRYKCDWLVITDTGYNGGEGVKGGGRVDFVAIKIIECKGPHIFPKDLIRFKGCRAEWPMFQFELHQRDRDGSWQRIL